ncbi:hypothetical protein J6590_029366 [Homalodisca vitripennis]|nr:hypothetical protein J6590_029366 [Homalodisca vitripennis]
MVVVGDTWCAVPLPFLYERQSLLEPMRLHWPAVSSSIEPELENRTGAGSGITCWPCYRDRGSASNGMYSPGWSQGKE